MVGDGTKFYVMSNNREGGKPVTVVVGWRAQVQM
jgi:hypothetical protein